jgi:hypothetical protein
MNRSSNLVFACFVLVFLAVTTGAQRVGEMGTDKEPIQWRTYTSGVHSQVRQPSSFVVRTEGDFQQYWRQAHRGNAPKDIDWNREMLAVIHMGTLSTSGYSVSVEKIERIRGEIVVSIVERVPSAGQMVAPTLTSPFMIVRIVRTAGAVKFAKRTESGSVTRLPGGVQIIDVGGQTGECRCACGCCRTRREAGHSCKVSESAD